MVVSILITIAKLSKLIMINVYSHCTLLRFQSYLNRRLFPEHRRRSLGMQEIFFRMKTFTSFKLNYASTFWCKFIAADEGKILWSIDFPGTLRYSKVRFVRLLRFPFQFTPPQGPLKNFALSPKHLMLCEILIKNDKFVTQWPHFFILLIQK